MCVVFELETKHTHFIPGRHTGPLLSFCQDVFKDFPVSAQCIINVPHIGTIVTFYLVIMAVAAKVITEFLI